MTGEASRTLEAREARLRAAGAIIEEVVGVGVLRDGDEVDVPACRITLPDGRQIVEGEMTYEGAREAAVARAEAALRAVPPRAEPAPHPPGAPSTIRFPWRGRW